MIDNKEDLEIMELLNKILDYSNIDKAYKQVVGNKGSKGVDGITTAQLQDYMQENWDRIKQEITEGYYQPQSVLGVEIPKASGGKRLLGIPAVIDRLIQQSIHQVLNPVFDVEFSENSYGFRKGRSAHQAILQSQRFINEGYQDIIDLDLKSFFDIVNQDYLMSLLYRKINDKMLLKLIRRYLQSDILLGGLTQQREKGKYNLRVSPKSFKRMKQKVKEITRKTLPLSFEERITKLKAFTRGWVNYYKYAHVSGKLKELDGWVRNHLRYCIWKHWKKPNKRMRSYIRLGISKGQAYAWSRSRMGGWAVAQRRNPHEYLSFSQQFQKSRRSVPDTTQLEFSFV